MKHFSHLNTALAMLESFNGDQPFHQYIRNFFSQQKKYGSKDRRIIAQLCYGYFRAGIFLPGMSPADQMLAGLFLTIEKPVDILAALQPAWNSLIASTAAEKCRLLGLDWPNFPVFPAREAISAAIDQTSFIPAHLSQPAVFLRIRPGHHHNVLKKLRDKDIGFSQPSADALQLSNAINLEGLLAINREVVVQDLSSQRTGSLLPDFAKDQPLSVYDCCAGGGGKSIMMKDRFPNAQLTLSDKRKSTLEQLHARFRQAGISGYRAVQGDAASPSMVKPGSMDLIIADVPCTGSGTWGRTPERLSRFQPAEIAGLVRLQQRIITGVRPLLKPGGWLLYITCSVYAPENEEMAAFISQQPGITLSRMEIITGYGEGADSMFGALFRSE